MTREYPASGDEAEGEHWGAKGVTDLSSWLGSITEKGLESNSDHAGYRHLQQKRGRGEDREGEEKQKEEKEEALQEKEDEENEDEDKMKMEEMKRMGQGERDKKTRMKVTI